MTSRRRASRKAVMELYELQQYKLLCEQGDEKKTNEQYKQVVFMQGAKWLEERDVELCSFLAFVTDTFGLHNELRWIGIIVTKPTPGVPYIGGRKDAVFAVHQDDMEQFTEDKRRAFTMRLCCLEDVYANGSGSLYPDWFTARYRPTWAAMEQQQQHYKLFCEQSDDRKTDEQYKQVVIAEGVDDVESPEDAGNFLAVVKDDFGLQHELRWIGMVVIGPTPGVPGTGGRWDAAFAVHQDDMEPFTEGKRQLVESGQFLTMRMRWLEDVFGNGHESLYPDWFTARYRPTWWSPMWDMMAMMAEMAREEQAAAQASGGRGRGRGRKRSSGPRARR